MDYSATRPVLPERMLLVVGIASCAIVFLLLVHGWIYPSIVDRSDAGAYQAYAFSFRTDGLLRSFGTFRTYGYPLFLYLLSFISGTDPHRLALITGVVQYGVFFSGTMWLWRLVHDDDPLLGRAVVIGLLLNPFTLSLTTDSLTEGLSTGAYVWVTAISLAIAKTKSARAFATLAVLGSSLSFFSIEIRPANILILFGWLSALCSMLIWSGHSSPRSANLAILASSLAFGSLFLLPQIIYNYSHYGSITPLPVCSLGEFQMKYGILAMKYDTIVHGQTAAGYNYRNPFFNGQVDGGLQWYLTHPVAGFGTIAAHLFNALNVTNIFTYVRDLGSPLTLMTRVVYWSMTVLGLYFIFCRCLPRLGASLASASTARHAVVFLCASQVLLLSICSISAVETRFGVFLNGLLVICGVRIILEPAIWSVRRMGSLGLTVVACVLVSYLVDSYGSENPFTQGLNFDFQAHRCVM